MGSIFRVISIAGAVFAGACNAQTQAPELSIEGRALQFHAFASQAFAASDANNYLTMDTSAGSFSFSDLGANVSVQVTSKLRVGAQSYDRSIGQLGQWRRSLVFTGKASIPRRFSSDPEVIEYVARTKGAIGYVSANASAAGVKTLQVK